VGDSEIISYKVIKRKDATRLIVQNLVRTGSAVSGGGCGSAKRPISGPAKCLHRYWRRNRPQRGGDSADPVLERRVRPSGARAHRVLRPPATVWFSTETQIQSARLQPVRRSSLRHDGHRNLRNSSVRRRRPPVQLYPRVKLERQHKQTEVQAHEELIRNDMGLAGPRVELRR